MLKQPAQVIIYCLDLVAESAFFTELGFRLEQVFPADDPRMMVLSGHGLVLRLLKTSRQAATKQAPELMMPPISDETAPLISPHGVVVDFQGQLTKHSLKPAAFDVAINHFDEQQSWVTGRAGMLYRDLIPSRLDGALIASNIMIPQGGPVADHVHYHEVAFQLIFCVAGWVEVVYEDQGKPFKLQAGDCVTQPPGIRHQVLQASDGLEVVEIGLPAEHMTHIDHELCLPTDQNLPERLFAGQRFCHHQQDNAQWQDWHGGLWSCETQVLRDSAGVAAVHVIKGTTSMDFEPFFHQHSETLQLVYVFQGSLRIEFNGQLSHLQQRDSFICPQSQQTHWQSASADLRCMVFTLNS